VAGSRAPRFNYCVLHWRFCAPQPYVLQGIFKATRFFALVLGYADAHKVLSRTRTRALGRVRVKHLIPRKAGKASRPKSTQ
jgi:hypothetical protein